jgi:hypothetical protein
VEGEGLAWGGSGVTGEGEEGLRAAAAGHGSGPRGPGGHSSLGPARGLNYVKSWGHLKTTLGRAPALFLMKGVLYCTRGGGGQCTPAGHCCCCVGHQQVGKTNPPTYPGVLGHLGVARASSRPTNCCGCSLEANPFPAACISRTTNLPQKGGGEWP